MWVLLYFLSSVFKEFAVQNSWMFLKSKYKLQKMLEFAFNSDKKTQLPEQAFINRIKDT